MKHLQYDKLRLVSGVRTAKLDANLGASVTDATVAPVNHTRLNGLMIFSTLQDWSASSELQANKNRLF